MQDAIDRAQADVQSDNVQKQAQERAGTPRARTPELNNRDLFNAAKGDKLIANWRETIEKSSLAREQLAAKNPIMDEVVKFAIAKASQGGGVLTDKDLERFQGSSELVNKMQQVYNRSANGMMTDADRKFMGEVIDLIDKRSRERLSAAVDRYAQAAKPTYGIEAKQARAVLEPLYPMENSPMGQGAPDPKKQAFIKNAVANGYSEEEAEKYWREKNQ